MRIKTVAGMLTAVALLATVTACSEENTAGTNAVASGGTFEFVSPGGQTSISYPENERKEIQNFSGPA
ncbi:MAG TPA: TlpA family protein disulfide reductase, partial [Corynebacterium falsenii]|nr:TlpA family protein disulfide reductase [Corynebacterium falsenii]